MYLCTYVPMYLCIYVSMYLCICLSVCLTIYLSICTYLMAYQMMVIFPKYNQWWYGNLRIFNGILPINLDDFSNASLMQPAKLPELTHIYPRPWRWYLRGPSHCLVPKCCSGLRSPQGAACLAGRRLERMLSTEKTPVHTHTCIHIRTYQHIHLWSFTLQWPLN